MFRRTCNLTLRSIQKNIPFEQSQFNKNHYLLNQQRYSNNDLVSNTNTKPKALCKTIEFSEQNIKSYNTDSNNHSYSCSNYNINSDRKTDNCENCVSKCKTVLNLDENVIRSIIASEFEKIRNSEQKQQKEFSELNEQTNIELSKNLDEKTIRQIFRSEIEKIIWKDSVKKNEDTLSILGAGLLLTGLVSLSYFVVSVFGFPGFVIAFIFWCIIGAI